MITFISGISLNETIENIELRRINMDSFAGRFMFNSSNNTLEMLFTNLSKISYLVSIKLFVQITSLCTRQYIDCVQLSSLKYSYFRNCYRSYTQLRATFSSIFLFKLRNRKKLLELASSFMLFHSKDTGMPFLFRAILGIH